jgi:hypothetical protein
LVAAHEYNKYVEGSTLSALTKEKLPGFTKPGVAVVLL